MMTVLHQRVTSNGSSQRCITYIMWPLLRHRLRRHALFHRHQCAFSIISFHNPLPDISASDLTIQECPNPKALPPLESLGFGTHYTDHMLKIHWSEDEGWSKPSIEPLAPLAIHPCAQVLHYGMQCFEGMKAYKGADGTIRMFRPEKNMARLARSCDRLQLPSFNTDEFLQCIKALLLKDKKWIPGKEGYSLYLRPACIATTPYLGVGPPRNALLFVVLSPVGPYFPGGMKPISLMVDTKNVRAFPGGVGDTKVGGNYAPTIKPQMAAAAKGYSQVLFALEDGDRNGAIVGESGAMNIFFLLKDSSAKGGLELVTPPLDGLILPGVTRDSVLGVVRSWDEIQVSERCIRLGELEAAHESGKLLEIFVTGTAAIIQPVSSLGLPTGKQITVKFDEAAAKYWMDRPWGDSRQKPIVNAPYCLTARVYKSILDIQYGHVDSDWSVPIGN